MKIKPIDDDFIEMIVAERIQTLTEQYWKMPPDRSPEMDRASEMFDQWLYSLPEQDRDMVDQYFSGLVSQDCNRTTYFYKAGLQDMNDLYKRMLCKQDE